jgi:plasmid rolling circle replication initiator protein Rep
MKLSYLKRASLLSLAEMAKISSEDVRIFRQSQCANFLDYSIDADWNKHLNRANFCRQRSCPVCSWLRSVKWRIRIFRGLPQLLRDYSSSDYFFLFLTLTVRNCHFSELRFQCKQLQDSWGRFSRLASFPAIGLLKSLEVSRPKDCFYLEHYLGRFGSKEIRTWRSELELRGFPLRFWSEYFSEEVHPHIHVLMMVSKSYWREGNYLDHSDWVSLWKRSARLDYDPIVDIRSVRSINDGVFEISKYCLKTAHMIDSIGYLISRQLSGLKLLQCGGVFRDYFSQSQLDRIDQDFKLGDEFFQEGVSLSYEWAGDRFHLSQLGNLFWEV